MQNGELIVDDYMMTIKIPSTSLERQMFLLDCSIQDNSSFVGFKLKLLYRVN